MISLRYGSAGRAQLPLFCQRIPSCCRVYDEDAASELPAGAEKSFVYSFPPQANKLYLEFAEDLPGPAGQGPRLPIQVR